MYRSPMIFRCLPRFFDHLMEPKNVNTAPASTSQYNTSAYDVTDFSHATLDMTISDGQNLTIKLRTKSLTIF